MNFRRILVLLLAVNLLSCASTSNQGTIASLDAVELELKDTEISDGLEKAMASYQQFLEKTPEFDLTPEALRRLADLKIQKEYGVVVDDDDIGKPEIKTIEKSDIDKLSSDSGSSKVAAANIGSKESEKDFEKRAASSEKLESTEKRSAVALPPGEAGADLENAGAKEAIALYFKLLKKYPDYEKNDQVLYQLSRAYEEIGEVEKAMDIMNRLVKEYPNSRYSDEVHFRRGEFYFTRKKFLDAEDAYGIVLKLGVGSVYYERALYKLGWSFYKQELYEDGLQRFFTLLDYKVTTGYDFDQTSDKIEKKRIDDTFSVVSLSLSNLGGAESVMEYFSKHGAREYEDKVYSHLAEFYVEKRRYSDATSSYNKFIEANPFNKVSPHFSMRVIEIYIKGGFPKLVIEAKKSFSSTYGINAEYWSYFNQKEYPNVIGYLKTNLVDLANHYHSLYQDKRFKKKKSENFAEALHWYEEYLRSFPREADTVKINYQLADLYLENKDFNKAAIEYERTAYDYPVYENSPKAAYAAVYAYREFLKNSPEFQKDAIKKEVVRSSLRLIDGFPRHEKATVVLGAAVDDLFQMRDFEMALRAGRRLIEEYPEAKAKIRLGGWLVIAHSSFDLELYADAEEGYREVLKLTPVEDKNTAKLVDNLAASIYKQGEQAKEQQKFRIAVAHFLRIGSVAPGSKIKISAEYDAAAVLIQIEDYQQAETVVLSFRKNYPGHKFQQDITKKIAFIYKELEKYALAAIEFERIAIETQDEDLIRDALLTAAEMYEKAVDTDNALRIYKQFVIKYPKPVEFALEMHFKIATVHKTRKEDKIYRAKLEQIIEIDKNAGEERTDRTRYLGATSSLIIVEPRFEEFSAIKLTNPLKRSIKKKKQTMKSLIRTFSDLVDYHVADVTAASTFYIAEIYYNFYQSLLDSDKPEGLSALELEEFLLAVEDQAFPFEEKAINIHEKNIELLATGIYSVWIDKSIEKLSHLLPARYAKQEASAGIVETIGIYKYMSAGAQETLHLREEEAKRKRAEAAALLLKAKSEAKEKAGKPVPQVDDASATGMPADEEVMSTPEADAQVVSPEDVTHSGDAPVIVVPADKEEQATTETDPATQVVNPESVSQGDEAPAKNVSVDEEVQVTPETDAAAQAGSEPAPLDGNTPATGVPADEEVQVAPETDAAAQAGSEPAPLESNAPVTGVAADEEVQATPEADAAAKAEPEPAPLESNAPATSVPSDEKVQETPEESTELQVENQEVAPPDNKAPAKGDAIDETVSTTQSVNTDTQIDSTESVPQSSDAVVTDVPVDEKPADEKVQSTGSDEGDKLPEENESAGIDSTTQTEETPASEQVSPTGALQ